MLFYLIQEWDFDLKRALGKLEVFVLTVKHSEFKLPFSTDRIHFPYGFIASTIRM